MTIEPKCPTTGLPTDTCPCTDCANERALRVQTYPWTGRLWSARATVDGRRVEPGAVEPFDTHLGAGPVPLRLLTPSEWPDDNLVGFVECLDEINGIGVAVGRTKLPPGTYSVGMDLRDVACEMQETNDGNDCEQIVSSARLAGVTVYGPESEQTPAWPEASILVHEAKP